MGILNPDSHYEYKQKTISGLANLSIQRITQVKYLKIKGYSAIQPRMLKVFTGLEKLILIDADFLKLVYTSYRFIYVLDLRIKTINRLNQHVRYTLQARQDLQALQARQALQDLQVLQDLQDLQDLLDLLDLLDLQVRLDQKNELFLKENLNTDHEKINQLFKEVKALKAYLKDCEIIY